MIAWLIYANKQSLANTVTVLLCTEANVTVLNKKKLIRFVQFCNVLDVLLSIEIDKSSIKYFNMAAIADYTPHSSRLHKQTLDIWVPWSLLITYN